MTTARRWLMVGLAVALLAALPVARGLLPVAGSQLTAAQLLSRVQHSASIGYSGYAESAGGLALPVTGQYTDLTNLFGGTTQLRVWSRSNTSWRVDTIDATGETDTYRDAGGLWTWSYESDRIARSDEPELRLPRPADLLPPDLARRLLSGASRADVTRISSVNVAGIAAPGIRLSPPASIATISAVDVWADPRTGLPLRVAVYSASNPRPAVMTSFLEVTMATPSASRTTFRPPAGADLHFDNFGDLEVQASRYYAPELPEMLAGLPRGAGQQGFGGVDTYGAGIDLLAVLHLPASVIGPIREQISGAVGAKLTAAGVQLQIGPLVVLVTGSDDGGGWVLTGTVNLPTVLKAASELPSGIGP